MTLDDILSLFQPQRINSQTQLDAAKKRGSFSASQEAEAKRKGFPSAQAAADWERQKQKSQQSQAVAGIGQAVKAGVDAAMSMHPKNLLDYVLNSINDATGQGGK